MLFPLRRSLPCADLRCSTIGLYNVHLLTHGSGPSSQSHACAMALSRALLSALGDRDNLSLGVEDRYGRKSLAKSGLAKRDPRVVERKKTGKKGAKAAVSDHSPLPPSRLER